MSVAVTAARGSCSASVIAMTPEPVPISRMFIVASRHGGFSRTNSTSCSVSGRGTRARLSLRNKRPKNSVVPSRCCSGFPVPRIANHVPQRSALGIGNWSIKFQVEIEALLAKDVCQQMLGVEPRAVHSVILEIAGSGPQNLKDGHWGS